MAKSKRGKRARANKKPLYKSSDFLRQVATPIRPGVGEEPYRSHSRRDFARLIHSAAFRRLQGKTQLFPGWESDFFRNRLTHSLEVAQIAESLAYKINSEIKYFQINPINTRIPMIAGLAHDLGHPPFGHNGEKALDDCMKVGAGGFEGNAQTLRILARLEKKQLASEMGVPIANDGSDNRVGLNLCYRVLASILKYDKKIPALRDKDEKLVKGYYESEADIVKRIKSAVAPGYRKPFKTIECQLMDLADDIAYSTYDLEDSFKAEFLTPIKVLSSSNDLLDRVAKQVSNQLDRKLTRDHILRVLIDLFANVFNIEKISSLVNDEGTLHDAMSMSVTFSQKSDNYAKDGYLRTDLTSDLISIFISGVIAEVNEEFPSMSRVYFDPDTELKVEVLKRYTYEATIMSPRLKVAEYRGYQIVKDIFEGLSSDEGYFLLPDDHKTLYLNCVDSTQRRRVFL